MNSIYSFLRISRPAISGALLAGVALMSGCQTAHVTAPIATTLGGNEPEQQLDFWHTLAEVPVTSNDDAFHGLLLYLDGTDPAGDYAGRVAALKDRGLLSARFDQPADVAVTRGTLAVAIVKALKVRGGWEMSLFGPMPRLAVRELQFVDVYPPSSPNQTFSGTEFLGIMGKVEDYQSNAKTDKWLPHQTGDTVEVPAVPADPVEPGPGPGAGEQPPAPDAPAAN